MRVFLFSVAFLVVYDVVAGRLFAFPGPSDGPPNALQVYFDYGRSVEGKIRRMVPPPPEQAERVANAGFINWELEQTKSVDPATEIRVTAYGQSFTRHIGRILRKAPDVSIRVVAGPGAPLNHSFTCYAEDPRATEANVAMLGILASSLPTMHSMTDMTRSFERPWPYCYPRYFLEGGELRTHELGIRSLGAFQEALHDTERWTAIKRELADDDAYFSTALFGLQALDRSTVCRLIRRGLGQGRSRRVRQGYLDENGYRDDKGLVSEARAIVREFGRLARERQQLPVALLFNNRGYADYLVKALGPTLEREGIPYCSTHEVASASDASLFRPDGHFIPEIDEKFAAVVLETLRERMH